MKKRKLLIDSEIYESIFKDEKTKINKIDGEWYFEIGGEVTSDLAEAVTLMMRHYNSKDEIWNLKIKTESEYITPEKCLFWLTGGEREWSSYENYIINWPKCHLDFQEEFGILIINIVKKSKTLGDIRRHFLKYLSLPILYDFALSKGFIN
jgi:hypothetical protein